MSELQEVAPDDWDVRLATLGVEDVYFARAYLESASLLGQGRPRYLALESKSGAVAFPILVRDAPDGYADVGTPMGYGGPVGSGADPPVAEFLAAYDAWCLDNRVVATFARFHPLLANQRLVDGRWHVEHIGHSVGWRLGGRGPDELLAGMSSHHRRLVRKARNAGVETTATPEPSDLATFVSLYEATMRRRNASAFYFFAEAYWSHLIGALGQRLVRFDAVLEEALVASMLCLTGGPWLHYHLGCSDESGQALGANHLLFHAAASWAAEHGFDRFHLGGGVGGFEDSLYEFKRRFDPEGTCAAYLGKAVHDRAAYLALTGVEEIAYDGYFPAYRAREGSAERIPPAQDP